MYKQKLIEQETTIVYDAEERIAHIYSAHSATIAKLDKLATQHPDVYKRTRSDQYGTTYETPARYIRFGKPASEATIQANRLKASRINSMRQ